MSFNITTNNVENYANLASFPATGQENVLYLDNSTSQLYSWNGLSYASASSSGNLDGVISLNGTIGPIVTGSDIDNLFDASLANGNYLLIQPTSDLELTGITAPAVGVNQTLFFSNTSNSKKVKFKNNNGSSIAANRFLLKGDITVEKNMGLVLSYDHSASRWRCVTKQN